MAERWVVVREPQGDEKPEPGPFSTHEEAQAWADEQKSQGRKIIAIRKMDMPIGPPDN